MWIETVRRRWKAFRVGVLDLIFPPQSICLCCGATLDERETDVLCPACVDALSQLEAMQAQFERTHTPQALPGIEYARAAFPYRDQAKTLIHRLKYQRRREAAVPLAKAMVLLPGGEEELLVPVPTSRRRQRERGYNQATVLCEQMADLLGMPMCEAIERTQERARQTGLSAQERRRNLVGCMRAGEQVRGKQILLIDDVCTTGATATEAARALLKAGAKSVSVFTAASTAMNEPGNAAKLPF